MYPNAQTQRAGAIAGGRNLAEAACHPVQIARIKEVPEKLDQLFNCIDQLDQTAMLLVDGMAKVLGPEHPQEEAKGLVGGSIAQTTSLGSSLEDLRARVMRVVDRLQSAHNRLEV